MALPEQKAFRGVEVPGRDQDMAPTFAMNDACYQSAHGMGEAGGQPSDSRHIPARDDLARVGCHA